jgi:hypothetical protein
VQLSIKPVKGINITAIAKPGMPYCGEPLNSTGVILSNDKIPAKSKNGRAQKVYDQNINLNEYLLFMIGLLGLYKYNFEFVNFSTLC